MKHRKNKNEVVVVQEGKRLFDGRKNQETVLNVSIYFALQLFPIIVSLIVNIITVLPFRISNYMENLIVICIVSNATSILNNAKNSELNGSIIGKVFLFMRSMIIALGSIVYSVLLFNFSEETQQIITNMNVIIIFTMICWVLTVTVSVLCVMMGGEI